MLQRFHLMILLGMIKPARTNGNIHFRRIPVQRFCFRNEGAAAQIFSCWVDVQSFIFSCNGIVYVRIQRCYAPFSFATQAAFVAHPAHVVAHNCLYGFGLQAVDNVIKTRPVINLAFSVGAFAVRAIEPHFVNFAVVGEQFLQLIYKHGVVAGRVAVTFGISVPRREIHAEFHPVFVAGIFKFAYNVAGSVSPG